MYVLKNYSHFILIAFFLSFFALTDCNAQSNNTKIITKVLTECLAIYPNPADSQAMMKIPDDISTEDPILVQIIFLGTKSIVEEIVIDRYRLIDTSNYPNGSYIAIPLIPNHICPGTQFQVLHK